MVTLDMDASGGMCIGPSSDSLPGAVAGGDAWRGSEAGGQGPLLDPAQSQVAQTLVSGTTVSAGIRDAMQGGLAAAGSGPVSTAASVASGGVSYATHDAQQEDPVAAHGERAAVGLIDMVFGLETGPVGVLDAATGGNISGLLKAGAAGFVETADLIGQCLGFAGTGDAEAFDTESLHGYSDAMESGEYGSLVQGLTQPGDPNDPRARLLAETTEGEVSPFGFMGNPYEY